MLDVINADRLPGQPACDEAMLAEAVAGRAPVDGGWWAELDRLAVDVLHDGSGTLRGVVSYARRPRDDAGLILWLHGHEDRPIIEALVGHALKQLADVQVVHAFDFATALTVGVEALPVRHRPETRAVLLERSFTESDLWRYLRRDLPAEGLPLAVGARVRRNADRPGWLIDITGPDGTTIADAEVSMPAPPIGVLWWIGVDPAHRGQGHGCQILASALDLLHQNGAREVILYVDDDAPGDDPERGRRAANALYDRAGFTEVDRLCFYQLTR